MSGLFFDRKTLLLQCMAGVLCAFGIMLSSIASHHAADNVGTVGVVYYRVGAVHCRVGIYYYCVVVVVCLLQDLCFPSARETECRRLPETMNVSLRE